MPEELERLHGQARELDLDVLVEVHDREELDVALERLDADVIGINNRDLTDFTVDVHRTFELLADVPAGKTVVSESGISSRAQVEELEEVGVDAVLVGEVLMRSDDPGGRLSRAGGRRGRSSDRLTAADPATSRSPDTPARLQCAQLPLVAAPARRLSWC